MGNIKQLLKQLINQPSLIDKLISQLPIHSITKIEDKLRFDVFGHQSQAYCLDLETLYYYNFRTSENGDFIDLISRLTNKPKDKVYNETYIFLCLNGDIVEVGGDYSYDYSCDYELKYPEPYEEDSLDGYPKIISNLFLKDNIWLTTQMKWGIRYDYKFKRVIIPVYQDEELVGAIGRLNKLEIEPYENKYMPTLKYSKSKVLFGFDFYKDRIKKTKTVILVESEKSVIKSSQLRDFPYPVLACGCSSVSRHQIERLNLLGVKRIILALDKGIEDENVMKNDLDKLQKYGTMKRLYYLDVDHVPEVILKNKECVFDLTNESVIKDVFKEYTKEIGGI